MGGQHQILRKQLSSEAAFYEARHVGEKERPARPSVDRKHAGLGIALPCPGIRLRMKHGKVHPIPAPAASPITRRPPGPSRSALGKGRPGGAQPPGMVPVPMGEQHPIELTNSEGAKGWLDLGRKGQGAALAPAGSRIHQQAMLRRFHQAAVPCPTSNTVRRKAPEGRPGAGQSKAITPSAALKRTAGGPGASVTRARSTARTRGSPLTGARGRALPRGGARNARSV